MRIELEFLSPDQARAENGFRPVARSPMHRRLERLGTEFEARHGWMVAKAVPGEEERALGIRDISHVGKIEVRGRLGEVPGAEVVRLTGHRALVLCENAVAAEVRASLGAEGGLVVDQTAALAGLRLEGPAAATLLRRLTDLDLDRLPAVGAVGRIQAIVLRDGPDAFRLYFPQQYADYLWPLVVDVAEPLGGGPKA